MKRFIFVVFVLLQDTFSTASPCLTDHQICNKRTSLIYQLDKALTEINTACGREPGLFIDWKSFEPILAGKDTYNVDACMKPLLFFAEYCGVNLEQAKKLLNTIEGFECAATGVDKQAITYKNGILKFMVDPTNDWRSDRKGPAVAEFVQKEMKAIFKVSAVTKQETEQAKRAEENKDKQAARDRESDQRKKQQEEVKANVAAANEKAMKKAEVYKAEAKRLTEWMQAEMKNIQASNLSAEEKGKKMTEMSQKYQADLQKATKAYSEGQ